MGLGQFKLAQQIPAFENAKIKRDINQWNFKIVDLSAKGLLRLSST